MIFFFYIKIKNSVFDLITTHTHISVQTDNQFLSLQITACVLLSAYSEKLICCWYTFELPRQVEAIQISTKQHMS